MSEIEQAIGILETHKESINILTSYNLSPLAITNSIDLAVQSLQEKAEREKPKALGLEELIKMGGEPIWCCYEKENKEIVTDCRLVSPGAFGCIGIDEKYLLYRYYGKTWLAYRHKPKHIGEANDIQEGEF